jgi:tetratricopeptide (TPR) repeat protein
MSPYEYNYVSANRAIQSPGARTTSRKRANYADASKALRLALKLNPKDCKDAVFALATIAIREGDLVRAAHRLGKLANLRDSSFLQGIVRCLQRKWDEAEAIFAATLDTELETSTSRWGGCTGCRHVLHA